jgi:putative endopeptidase
MKIKGRVVPVVKAAIMVGLAVLASGKSHTGLARPSATGSSPAVTVLRACDPAMMDTRVSACTNLFEFADGNWVKQNPIPPAYPEWGMFSVLQIKNREELRGILEQAARDRSAAPGSNTQKIGDFYASCMDRPAIEHAGVKPLQPEFDRINAIHDARSLEDEIARLQHMEVNAVFGFGSTQDEKDSSQVIAGAGQGGLGLPDRDYYTKTDPKSQKIRQDYVAHVARMLGLLGDPAPHAASEAAIVMKMETELAEASMTPVELRDPVKTYHKMTLQQLRGLTPGFSWDAYFDEVGAPRLSAVDVMQPQFFKTVGTMISSLPIADWKTYLRWQLLDAAAPALSSPFVQENFNFNDKILQGTKQILPRWQRCVRATDNELGFALGREYVKEYFPPPAKARALKMVRNLVAALHTDIQALPWMDPATKQAALTKLDSLNLKIGYPDKWRDYSAYHVMRGPYVVNYLNGNRFDFQRDIRKIGRPVNRNEWEMTPPTINAYYRDKMNEIVFPAGILQPPFFDPKADDAVNYGGIGAVIGHEMTHGFDDQGRQFDAHGNLKNWWTPEDLKRFNARAGCIVNQFDAYTPVDQLHENGKLVLGESIADLGGLTIAYKAFQKTAEGRANAPKIDGYTPDQRFFINYAQLWATSVRPQFVRLLLNVDPHPIGFIRAFAAPSNMPAFARAFGCKPGDKMVRPPQQRCQIW